ncbi:MAG: DegT/DnrJ/EryC1/StrS family aminotransferase [Patescibacteria group bacterium]
MIPQMEPWFDELEAKAVFDYMQSGGWIMEFKKTEELERMIAEYVGAKYCILTNNGTISLTLALLALGLKAGDEVLVPDFTMIASPNAAKLVGIEPLLVDIDKETLSMNLEEAERAITPRTKALMYVAFNGRSGEMNAIVEFCKKHNLFLLEDAAQALGSKFKGKHLGTFGHIGSFSFSVPKVITTGQGGALVTDNEELAQKIRRLKDFGRTRGGLDIHDEWGWNFKFTDLQATIGIEQMKKLPSRVERKKAIWRLYQKELEGIDFIEWVPTNLEDTSPWFIEILINDPDKLAAYLKEQGIGSRRVYPAIHTQTIYQGAYQGKSFPAAEEIARRGLWLPSSSKLSDEDIVYIASAIKEYYHQ